MIAQKIGSNSEAAFGFELPVFLASAPPMTCRCLKSPLSPKKLQGQGMVTQLLLTASQCCLCLEWGGFRGFVQPHKSRGHPLFLQPAVILRPFGAASRTPASRTGASRNGRGYLAIMEASWIALLQPPLGARMPPVTSCALHSSRPRQGIHKC